MAKSNCPAEDSAPPQASAGQLTPRFLPLSLSGRLLQVTVAHIPVRRERRIKGAGFLGFIRSEGPRRQMQDFEKVGERGSFNGGKSSSLVVCFCRLGRGYLFAGRVPFSLRFLNAAFVGGPSVLSKTRKTAKRLSRTPFSVGIWVVEVTSE